MSPAARKAVSRIRSERAGERRWIAVRGEYPWGLAWNLVDAVEYRRQVVADHRAFRRMAPTAD